MQQDDENLREMQSPTNESVKSAKEDFERIKIELDLSKVRGNEAHKASYVQTPPQAEAPEQPPYVDTGPSQKDSFRDRRGQLQS